MKLYHYSNKELDTIEIDRFGDNAYTANDKKIPIKRSFFYLEANPKEYRFKHCQYCYIAEIEPNDIYNLVEDKENLKQKYSCDIVALLEHIREHYKGIIYSVGFDICCLFVDIVPIKI